MTIEVAPLQMDDQCLVRWRDQQLPLRAKVVERRPRGHRKRKNEDVSAIDLDTCPADALEYYVHYIGHDRRLDEWITLDRIDIDTIERSDESNLPMGDDSARSILRRRSSFGNLSVDEHAPETADQLLSGGNFHGGPGGYEKEHHEMTKCKNIDRIVMGPWEVEAWYFSNFPPDYSDLPVLYVCEFCLTYMRKVNTYRHHLQTCNCRRPPGTQIYRDESQKIAVYEIDGKQEKAYCQKLCLLAKLFLDHKTIFYDTTPFYFYVVCEEQDDGDHIVGYFSKEKHSEQSYNLACILTLPQKMRQGYGKFIIDLSYSLTRRQGQTGSPEKPLSDLGKVSYRSYWTYAIIHFLSEQDPRADVSIQDMARQTGISREDLISTMQSLQMIKNWKGQHVVYVNQETLQQQLKQCKPFRRCQPECLHWEPPAAKDEPSPVESTSTPSKP